MHHALEIQEILADIFHHIPPVSDKYSLENPNPTLAALARICRAFNEPALDALWEALPNLAPIARCLPEISRELRPRLVVR